jgi:hypothetical protein
VAFIAQTGGGTGAHGIGNVSRAAGLTVQEVQAFVKAFCAQ